MDQSTPMPLSSYTARPRNSSTLKSRLVSEGNETEVEKTLRRILQSQKQVTDIHETLRKIDEALQIFSSKIRHANYLEQRQHTYVRKLDDMEKEIYGLKLQQKMREMQQSDKQAIDQLLRRNREYREESDRFFVLLQEIRRKVAHTDRVTKLLEKQNEQLRRENAQLNRQLKLEALKEKEERQMTLKEAITHFLEEKLNQKYVIYNFVRNAETNGRFLDDLGCFVDSLIKMTRGRSDTPERLPTLSPSKTATSTNRRSSKPHSLHRFLKKSPIPSF